jgi:hypothetical protein
MAWTRITDKIECLKNRMFKKGNVQVRIGILAAGVGLVGLVAAGCGTPVNSKPFCETRAKFVKKLADKGFPRGFTPSGTFQETCERVLADNKCSQDELTKQQGYYQCVIDFLSKSKDEYAAMYADPKKDAEIQKALGEKCPDPSADKPNAPSSFTTECRYALGRVRAVD